MDPLKGCFPALTARFIDEYRLLCIDQGKLVLWDSSVEHKYNQVTFELEEGLCATRVMRNYELDKRQSEDFCANPEEGIVVVMVEGCSAFDMLVIPTKVFSGFKTLERPDLEKGISPTSTVRQWEEWGGFVTKLKPPPGAPFNHYVFHTHVLFLPKRGGSRYGTESTDIFPHVADFSLYSRRLMEDKPTSEPAGAADGDGQQPLTVTLHGRSLETNIDEQTQLFTTEYGVLVIRVRVSVVAKFIGVLT